VSSSESLISRLIARVEALTPQDWRGKAGARFRRTTEAISDFAEEHHVTPREVLDEGVELGRRKLEGVREPRVFRGREELCRRGESEN
jgi:hypothetical protein